MRRDSFPRTARGFTLVEIAVVIVIMGFLLAMLIGITSNLVGQQRRDATRQRLANVETSLALFVSQNQRLPCPADGALTAADANAGLERYTSPNCTMDGTAGRQTRGVVPWRTLGLAEQDVTDGWSNRLTYRVAPELVAPAAMNFTSCDPGGTGPAVGGTCAPSPATCSSTNFPGGCTPPSTVTANKGLCVKNRAATPVNVMDPAPATGASTGAAYVVVSHGENGAAAYSSSGVVQAGEAGTEETAQNGASVVFQSTTSPTCATAWLVDDFANYQPGAGRFDDFVLRPAILAVVAKALLGARAH